MLKLDPTNTELLAQKQRLLGEAVENTEERLKALRKAQEKAKKELENGDLGQDQYDALQREIIETEQKLNALKDSANKAEGVVEDAAEQMADAFDNAGESLENIGSKLDAGNLMEVADTLSGIGDKIVEFGEKAAGAFTGVEDATSRVNAYFDLTGEEAERMGKVIEGVFLSGITDNMGEAADAVALVKNNIKEIDDTTLQKLATDAINLEQVFGSDISETMRGVNALMENFQISATEAFDLIVKGSQNGLDKTSELGDNLAEYSGKFAQAGYSAEEYFQLLENGLDNGAYNLDKVNDAINEVTTGLADGTIEEAISTYSDDTQKLFSEWENGGATQRQVIDSIVKDIKQAETQQEALTLAATAFGTMAEDGTLKFITSLTSLGSTFDNTTGAAERMSEQSTTSMQSLQSAINETTIALAPVGEELMRLAVEYIPPLVEGITNIIKWFTELPGPIKTAIGVLAGVMVVISSLAPIITAVMGIVTTFGATVLLPVIGIIAGVTAAITAVILVIKNWGSITEWLGNLWKKVVSGLSNVWDSFKTAVSEKALEITQNIASAWTNIKNKISQIMNSIKTSISNVWTAILNNPIVQQIVDTVQARFENLKTMLSGVWEGIKTMAAGAWELIKNTILAPVLLLTDLIRGDFESFKTDFLKIQENIATAAGTIWNGIKQVVSNLVLGLMEDLRLKFTGIWNIASTIWTNIKNAVTTKFTETVIAVKEKATTIKNAVKEGFESALDSVKETLSFLFETVEEGFRETIEWFQGLPERAFNWGVDFINGLIDGIKSMIGKVQEAAASVGNAIREFLHFSRPDVGPLHDYETWMPDMMKGLSKGIRDNTWRVEKEMSALASKMSLSFTGENIMHTPRFVNHNVVNIGNKMLVDEVNEQLGLQY